ncbi:hypothetical protein [Brevibacterium samyangense]|uniref:Uncharacterized protein n=1 Tax=Brevibacterium samyangense TaxID=366888 RepID=A0ABP5EVP3_9MICO
MTTATLSHTAEHLLDKITNTPGVLAVVVHDGDDSDHSTPEAGTVVVRGLTTEEMDSFEVVRARLHIYGEHALTAAIFDRFPVPSHLATIHRRKVVGPRHDRRTVWETDDRWKYSDEELRELLDAGDAEVNRPNPALVRNGRILTPAVRPLDGWNRPRSSSLTECAPRRSFTTDTGLRVSVLSVEVASRPLDSFGQ